MQKPPEACVYSQLQASITPISLPVLGSQRKLYSLRLIHKRHVSTKHHLFATTPPEYLADSMLGHIIAFLLAFGEVLEQNHNPQVRTGPALLVGPHEAIQGGARIQQFQVTIRLGDFPIPTEVGGQLKGPTQGVVLAPGILTDAGDFIHSSIAAVSFPGIGNFWSVRSCTQLLSERSRLPTCGGQVLLVGPGDAVDLHFDFDASKGEVKQTVITKGTLMSSWTVVSSAPFQLRFEMICRDDCLRTGSMVPEFNYSSARILLDEPDTNFLINARGSWEHVKWDGLGFEDPGRLWTFCSLLVKNFVWREQLVDRVLAWINLATSSYSTYLSYSSNWWLMKEGYRMIVGRPLLPQLDEHIWHLEIVAFLVVIIAKMGL